MMDRTTGKTLSDAYVEFATVFDMRRAIETKNQKPLKGRVVSVTECCQEELLKVVFPKWRGHFQGISAIPPPNEVLRTMTTAAGGGSSSGCPPFITREEINSLLVVCKNYKVSSYYTSVHMDLSYSLLCIHIVAFLEKMR